MTAAGQLLGRRCMQRCSCALGDMMSRILALCTQHAAGQNENYTNCLMSAMET